jgi:tRNA nucleotidyltransferase (CCA-adding enzyme)
MTSIKSLVKEVIESNSISNEEKKFIDSYVREFVSELKKRIKERKVNAEVFVGGSYAKGTMFKKENYDVDVFLRFDKEWSKGHDISLLLEKLLSNWQIEKIHGSRDYFCHKVNNNLEIEIIPVLKINKLEDAENVTDLSYFHVNYINKKLNEKTRKEVGLLKMFCQANHIYGAESYIQGFSGYSIELLIIKYGSFEKVLKELVKTDEKEKNKLIIDIEKLYKNRVQVMMDLNENKLSSPIILIDPTYKIRNALAALSSESLEKFKSSARGFLKNPSKKYFEEKKIDINKVKENASKNKHDFVLLEIETDKQEGDIAGSKLVKFYRHLSKEVERYFIVKERGFSYNKKQMARFYIVAQNKKELIVSGPEVKDEKNSKAFHKEHKATYTKKGRWYAKDLIKFDLNKFINFWKKKYSNQMNEMSIKELRFVE